jgi:hypothetical protein
MLALDPQAQLLPRMKTNEIERKVWNIREDGNGQLKSQTERRENKL